MRRKKTVVGINGSASQNSSNLSILKFISELRPLAFELVIIEDLSDLPHFRTELSDNDVPAKVVEFRKRIADADGVIISTPEYIFSIPSRLKNAIEWCVSANVYTDKPIGIITASASGERGHEELKLLMKTVQGIITDECTLLIQGIKGKVGKNGDLNSLTQDKIHKLVDAFTKLSPQ
jgi:chromate reductase, NAD(P)H dehydrogenase (quinone)